MILPANDWYILMKSKQERQNRKQPSKQQSIKITSWWLSCLAAFPCVSSQDPYYQSS